MDQSRYDRNASQHQQINIVPTAVPHFLKSPFSCLSFNVERAFQTELGCVDVGLNFSHIKFPKFMSFCEQDNHMLYKMPNEKIFQHNSPKTNKYPFEVVPYRLFFPYLPVFYICYIWLSGCLSQNQHLLKPPLPPTAAQCTLLHISQLHFTMHFSDVNLLHIFCSSL